MRSTATRPVRPTRFARIVAAAVLAPLTLAACSSAGAAGGPDGAADRGTKEAADGGPVTVTVTPKGDEARPGEPIRVTARGGSLTGVQVFDGRGGKLSGSLSDGGALWTSDRVAAPGTAYRVTAGTKTKGGVEETREASFSTAKADRKNLVTLEPLDAQKGGTKGGMKVGVAHPVSIVFDRPVRNKAAVEKQLKVTDSHDTEGSWGWVKEWGSGRDRVDWRPREYWKPNTEVTVNAELNGVDSGPAGGWFVRDYSFSFTVGDHQVVEVDLDAKKLTLERDGKAVRTIPVSGGDPGGASGGEKRSWGGTTVLMDKAGTVRMNSETVGLGDAYDKQVEYSMHLTRSGMYAHAAPWNASYFGRANRSSGCIGMSTAEAASFYRQVQVGDPFEITGEDTKGVPAQGNGFSNWNLSWEQWRKLSALR